MTGMIGSMGMVLAQALSSVHGSLNGLGAGLAAIGARYRHQVRLVVKLLKLLPASLKLFLKSN